jgi:hypothetical protein
MFNKRPLIRNTCPVQFWALFRCNMHVKNEKVNYPCNRSWKTIGLWEIETPTFSRQSAHRCGWRCQTYATAALYPPGRFLVQGYSNMAPATFKWLSLRAPHTHVIWSTAWSFSKDLWYRGRRTSEYKTFVFMELTSLPHIYSSWFEISTMELIEQKVN